MKTRVLLIALTLFSLSDILAQCPGAVAESYKTKLQNAGTNMEATTAYSHLAAYYNYKCKCDNGVTNPEELAKFIKNYASSYSSIVNKYGTMTPVNGCKGLGSENSTSQNNTSSNNKKEIINQSTEIVTDLIQGNTDEAGNKSVLMATEGVIEGDNKKIIGGVAMGLVSLFSNSKAREDEPLTLEELERIRKLDKRRYSSIITDAFNDSSNKTSFSKPNDTTLVRVGDGEKIIATHKPIEDVTKVFIKSIKTFNIYSRQLEKELIIKSHHSNSTRKLFTSNNYVRGYSRLINQDRNENAIKVIDLITDETIFDTNKSSQETIFDERNREIGKRVIYNNQTYKEQYFDKGVLKKEILFSEGVKEKEFDFVFVKGNRIPTVIIDYDNRGLKIKKREATYEQLIIGNSTVTFYNNDKPNKTIIYKNGSKSKEISYN